MLFGSLQVPQYHCNSSSQCLAPPLPYAYALWHRKAQLWQEWVCRLGVLLAAPRLSCQAHLHTKRRAQSLEAQLQLARATSEQREGALARHRSRALALAGNPGAHPSVGQAPPRRSAAESAPEGPALSMREDMARRAARMAAVLGGEGSQARPS